MKRNYIKGLAVSIFASCLGCAYAANEQSVIVVKKDGRDTVFNIDVENGYLKTTSNALEICENANSNTFTRIDYASINKVLFQGAGTGALKVFSDKSVAIFPNPASDFVNVINYEGNGKCEVYSIEGKLVSVKDIEGKRINISDLASGEYILKIGDKSFKLIKK